MTEQAIRTIAKALLQIEEHLATFDLDDEKNVVPVNQVFSNDVREGLRDLSRTQSN